MGNRKRETRARKQMEKDELQARLQLAAKELTELLDKHKVALSPQLEITPGGINPVIKLIDNGDPTPKENA